MQLIGMLDSPYVRRVAVSLHHTQTPFEHSSLSVFRDIETFSKINPLVKAPTFICDDGEVLMDSTLILAYLEKLFEEHQKLMPSSISDYQRATRIIGLALNVCDKSVQIVYERDLRPQDKQHQPWLDRITDQLLAAYNQLEAYAAETTEWLLNDRLTQTDITVAIAWQFTQFMIPDVVSVQRYPAISALSLRAEALPAFLAAPMDKNWSPKG